MMIPEAWENHATMPAEKRAFYRYHASLMEPWDGPASITFTDGTVVGAVLDRNGLRPSRYWVTDDDRVIMASEAGVVDVDPARVVQKGRLQPGRMFLVDTAKGRIVGDDEIKHELASEQPYGEWLRAGPRAPATTCPTACTSCRATSRSCAARRSSGTPTRSSSCCWRRWPAPAARRSARWAPTRRSRCSPTARACCSTTSSSCSRRSPTRRSTPSARSSSPRSRSTIGPEANLLEPGPESCRQIELPFPIIDNDELAKLIHIHDDGDRPEFAAAVLSGLYHVAGGGRALARRARPRAGRGVGGDRRGQAHPRPLRSRLQRRVGADPVAAPHLGRAPPPDPREDPHQGRARRRSAATPARCTTWRCSSATAPAPSTRTWRSSRSRTSSPPSSTAWGAWTRRWRSRTTSRPRARASSR